MANETTADECEEATSLERKALERKERLRELRRKREGVSAVDKAPDADEEAPPEKLPKPVFRSYRPINEDLKEGQLPASHPERLDSHIEEPLAAGKETGGIEQIDLTNLAPRKPDWDLKRDVQRKLDKLERRTQRAIAEMVRERLQASAGGDNLARAVGDASLLDQQYRPTLAGHSKLVGPSLPDQL